ncbi:hypothetical protein T484DRAFT_1847922, partial [Baffinella frigidus]
VVALGGVHATLGAMRASHERAAIQEAGCGVLRQIAATADRRNVAAIARRAGVLEPVAHYAGTVGCGVLRQIAAGGSNVDHARRAGDAGAVEAVVAALEEHGEAPGCCEQACGALRHLLHNCDANKRRLVERSGIEAVVAAMRRHPDTVALQEQGCWLIIYAAAMGSATVRVSS